MARLRVWLTATACLGIALICTGGAVCLRAEQAQPRFVLSYATLLGGNGWDQAREVIPYPDGSVLVGAQTCSTDMPITEGALQTRYAGDDPELGHPGIYGGDCYLARLSANGDRLLWATYFGGSHQERNVYGMGLDSAGNIVITTNSRSPDISTTPGCFQRAYAGGDSDTVVAKITPDGRRVLWCSYIGGSRGDSPRGGLTIDQEDNVYIVGTSDSPDFPTTPGALQSRLNGPRDSTVVKLKADGSSVVFATYVGGSGEDDAIMGVRVGADGSLYMAGHTKSRDFPVTGGAAQARLGGQSDCYLVRLSSEGNSLIYATYLGGAENEFAEHRLWLHPDGSVLLAGWNGSADFPTTPNAFQRERHGPGDGFLVRLAGDGTRFLFGTLLGGSGAENLLMPTPDAEGNIWVVGSTSSPDLPVTPDAFQRRWGGGEDGLIAAFSPDGSRLVYCSYLGGSGDDMVRSLAFGAEGQLYLVGNTSSPDFPTTPSAVQRKLGQGGDAFVVCLRPA